MTRAASTAAISLALSLAALAAYVATMAPGVLGGDAGELQFVSPILGLTHPTGYPLLVLVNHFWAQMLPFGSVAWRISLLNAMFAAGTLGVLALIGRSLSHSAVSGALGALFLAFSPIYWSQATGSDKYTLNALLLSLVILALLHWSDRPSDGRLALVAVAYGLSLTNHRAMLLCFPAVALFVIMHGWRPSSLSRVIGLLVLFIAPLALYAYVPWAGARGLPPGTWPVRTPAELLEYFLDRGYTSQIQLDGGSGARLADFARVSVSQLGPLGIALGFIGAAMLAARRISVFVLITLTLLPNLLVAANYLLPSNYAIPRHWVFFIPVYLCWAMFVAAGVRDVEWLAGLIPWPGPSRLLAGALAAFVVMAGGSITWAPAAVAQARAHRSAETLDGYRQDLQRGYLADRFARLSLEASEPNAIIVGDWEQSTALWYLQYVEGLRRDVRVRYPIERLEETLSDPALSERAVYLTRPLAGIERLGPTSAAGPLIQVRGPAASLPAEGSRIDAELGGAARLSGVQYLVGEVRVGGVLPLMLYWQALGDRREDASVSVRLVNASGEDVTQSDSPQPVLGTSPMSHWTQGGIVADYYELAVSNRLAPGEYPVEALLYRGPAAAPLPVTGADANARGDRVRLPPIQVR